MNEATPNFDSSEDLLDFVFGLTTMSQQEVFAQIQGYAKARLDDQVSPQSVSVRGNPLSSALETLRDIHHKKHTEPKTRLNEVKVNELVDQDIDQKNRKSVGTSQNTDNPYQRIREHFSQHENRLRREATVTQTMLDQLFATQEAQASPEPATQVSINLQQGSGEAKFQLQNTTQEQQRLSFTTRPSQLPTMDNWADLTILFEPDIFVLEKGESKVVSVKIESEITAAEQFTIKADVRNDGLPVGSLYLVVLSR